MQPSKSRAAVLSSRSAYRPRNRKMVRIHLRRRHLVVLAGFALFIFLRVWQKVNVDHQYRKNGALAEELKNVRSENLLLEARIEELRSMENINKVVREGLKMEEVPVITLREKNAFERLTDTISKKRK